MIQRPKKAIVFDFDGTITDSMEMENISMAKAIHSVGCISISPEDITGHYGPTERGIISSIVPPGKEEEAWKNCLVYYRELSKNLKPFDGIIDILSSLKQRESMIFLVTGRSRETLDISLHDMNLERYFLKTYTGSDSGTNKEKSLTSLFNDFNLKNILSAGYSHDKDYRIQLEKKNPGNVCASVQELKNRLMEITESH